PTSNAATLGMPKGNWRKPLAIMTSPLASTRATRQLILTAATLEGIMESQTEPLQPLGNGRYLIGGYKDDSSSFLPVWPAMKSFIHSRISSRTRRKIESRSSSLLTPGGGGSSKLR